MNKGLYLTSSGQIFLGSVGTSCKKEKILLKKRLWFFFFIISVNRNEWISKKLLLLFPSHVFYFLQFPLEWSFILFLAISLFLWNRPFFLEIALTQICEDEDYSFSKSWLVPWNSCIFSSLVDHRLVSCPSQ